MAPYSYDEVKHYSPQETVLSFPSESVWRLVDVEYDDPVLNLAVEEAIMEKVSEGQAANTIRFWTNRKPTVVIGKFQIPELEVNKEACRKHGVNIVRRFTGGGTVYHDKGNLNYAISARRDCPLIPRTIDRIRPTLCAGVVEALRMLGLDAKFEPKGAYIQVNGKKVSGTAAVVKRTVVFLHGTLLIDPDLTRLREVLDVPPYQKDARLKRLVKSNRKKVTSIKEQKGREVSSDQVKEALEKGFAKTLGIQLHRGELLPSEIVLANMITTNRCNEINIF
nr:lipoate--protein ligase family protein [Candidatus Njordarchaeota archaeon]